MILLLEVLYNKSEDGRPNVVIAPVEKHLLRHLADANLTRMSAKYGDLKFLLPHLKNGSNYFKKP